MNNILIAIGTTFFIGLILMGIGIYYQYGIKDDDKTSDEKKTIKTTYTTLYVVGSTFMVISMGMGAFNYIQKGSDSTLDDSLLADKTFKKRQKTSLSNQLRKRKLRNKVGRNILKKGGELGEFKL